MISVDGESIGLKEYKHKGNCTKLYQVMLPYLKLEN